MQLSFIFIINPTSFDPIVIIGGGGGGGYGFIFYY
jgi:hypothetical protein